MRLDVLTIQVNLNKRKMQFMTKIYKRGAQAKVKLER